MMCKCGFHGWAEYGTFKLDGYKKLYPLWHVHFRCPKCKKNGDIILETVDDIMVSLLFPSTCSGVRGETPKHEEVKKVVHFMTANGDTVGFSINCPICQWGHASGVNRKDYDKIQKMIKEGKIKPQKEYNSFDMIRKQKVSEVLWEKKR
jgi:hypothetical protein